MPSLTINGHSVTVDDSFDKLSPEDQNATVDHIAAQLHAGEKPSGVVAGLGHGLSEAASGIASTLGLGGVKSETLDNIAKNAAPKDYKAAPIIREGGHWYNPSDYNLKNVPQALAEQAPGLTADLIAGKTGASIGNKIGGVRGAVIGGLGAGLGSMALRTFGPGAHENAKARTGDENAEVTSGDMLREGGKQLVTAVPNAIGLGRLIPGLGTKVAGVGVEGATAALKKYLGTVATEAATGGARDAVNQIGTTVGTDKGIQYDPNRTAEAAVTSGAAGGVLAAPRLAGEAKLATKFRQFGGDNAEAATALANRQLEHADGKNLVGPLGGTRTAAEAVNAAHKDVHTELQTAAKGLELSQDNANTLQRVKDGGNATNKELAALETEAPTEVTHLARQAALSAKLRSMGTLTNDKFTGGLSGQMERLRPIDNPVGTGTALAATAALGHAGGLGMLGTFAPHVIGGIYGAYGLSRLADKLSGSRSPAQGFTDKFGDPNAAIRTPAAPMAEPVEPEAPQPTLRAELNTNARLEEGMAKIASQLAAAKKKSMISAPMPLLKQLAQSAKPPEAPPEPAPPNISPIALKMTQARMKAGLPPEAPAPAPEAPAAPDISPVALKMTQARMKAGLPPIAPEPAPAAPAAPVISPVALKMAQARMKAGLPPVAPEPTPAPPAPPEAPNLNPVAMKMLGIKMKAGLPPEAPEPQPAPAPEAPMPVITPIAQKMLMQKLKQGLPEPAPAAPETPQISPVALRMTQARMKAGLPPVAPETSVPVQEGPTSPSIAELMDRFRARHEAPAAPAAPAAPMQQPPAPAAPVAPALAPAMAAAPVIEKISKKSGKPVEATQAAPEEESYVPMAEKDLYRKFMTDDEMVDHEFAKYEPAQRKAYGKTSVENREGHREDTLEATAEHSAHDRSLANALYHRLDHIKDPGEAQRAINHYTSQMSSEASAAVNARYTPAKIAQRWKKRKTK